METVGDLDLRDEYALLPDSAVLSDVAKALLPVKNSAVLLRKKKQGPIIGVVQPKQLLQALKSGKDPVKTTAKTIMDENVLRIKSSTPLEISQSIVLEKQPAAIIVLDESNQFLGYLSPHDYSSYTHDELNSVIVEDGTIETAVDLRDEFAILPLNSSLADVSLRLRIPHVQYVLLRHKKDGIKGVVTPSMLLKIFSDGRISTKSQAKKHMRSNLLRLRNDTPVDVAIKEIKEKRPDVVMVLDKEGIFVGVLTPRDYHKLLQPKVEANSETIAPPRPPMPERAPPPMPDSPDSDDIKLPLRNLSTFLLSELFPNKSSAVVWEYEGSSLILYKENTSIQVAGKHLVVDLNLYSDQTQETVAKLEYELPFEPDTDFMATEGDSSMPELLEKVWREVLYENIWLVIINWMRESHPRRRKQVRFGLNTDGSLTVSGSQQRPIESIEVKKE